MAVTLFLAPVAAFIVTAALMLVLRRPAQAFGLVDLPGGRKTHRAAVPAIGGIAMYFGVLATTGPVAQMAIPQLQIFAAAALILVTGVLDDRFGLGPRVRIAMQLVAAAALVSASGHRVDALGDLLGFGGIELGPLSFPLTVIAMVALVNAFNMLDGMDGVAGGVALVALSGLASQLVPVGGVTGVIVLALLGSVSAFLIFNVPARFNRRILTFMGDAGSTLIGFALAGLSLAAIQPSRPDLPPVLILWLLHVPVLELFSSTFRRLARGVSPLQADRDHLHDRLLQAGLSGRAIFAMYASSSAGFAVAGFSFWRLGFSESALFYLFVLSSALWCALASNAVLLRSWWHGFERQGSGPGPHEPAIVYEPDPRI
jgi:UDP-GlcNAc:undecaprenyl-phosphate GlcNAc-1-phosphate transferase